MNYRALRYSEWCQQTEWSITGVVISGNEIVIHWQRGQDRATGGATSTDGREYSGTWTPVPPFSDRGRFSFRLYDLTTGERLLLGNWHSELHGQQKGFFLLVEHNEASTR